MTAPAFWRNSAPARPATLPNIPVNITVSAVQDLAAVETKWRDLEARANASFFQTWTWTGCLAEQRFTDPVLVEACEDGQTVALALFNRSGRTLYLGESGKAVLDDIFIECNGVLTEAGQEDRLARLCLQAIHSPGDRGFGHGRQHLVLSGVNATTLVAAEQIGTILRIRDRPTYFVELSERAGDFLQRRSANTRHQLRRSDRDYAKSGAITIERAETLPQALEFLDRLGALHQATWQARGHPGAFANPSFGHFHRALVARGLDRGEIDLLRIAAGPGTVGFLYNFRYRGHSLAYQSGLDHVNAGRHRKPGLTSHHKAIQFAAASGATRYDFLAGDDRYKRSLADRTENLHWIEIVSPYSPRCLVHRLKTRISAACRWREG